MPRDQCRIPFGLSYYCPFDIQLIFSHSLCHCSNIYSHQCQYTVAKSACDLQNRQPSQQSKYISISWVWVFIFYVSSRTVWSEKALIREWTKEERKKWRKCCLVFLVHRKCFGCANNMLCRHINLSNVTAIIIKKWTKQWWQH